MTKKYKILGLGSNLGNKLSNLEVSIGKLEDRGFKVLKKSKIYETEPVDCLDQQWFLNQVVIIDTDKSVEHCYLEFKEIEKEMGRTNLYRNGPRPIDIDILVWDDLIYKDILIYKNKRLTIPHSRICERKFVLVPIIEATDDTALLIWLMQNTPGQKVMEFTEEEEIW